jgi:hypothetical protein
VSATSPDDPTPSGSFSTFTCSKDLQVSSPTGRIAQTHTSNLLVKITFEKTLRSSIFLFVKDEHPDRRLVSLALDSMRSVAYLVNESKRRAEMQQYLVHWQSGVDHWMVKHKI